MVEQLENFECDTKYRMEYKIGGSIGYRLRLRTEITKMNKKASVAYNKSFSNLFVNFDGTN